MKIRRGENILIKNDYERDYFLNYMEVDNIIWASGVLPTNLTMMRNLRGIPYPYDIKLRNDNNLYMGDNYMYNRNVFHGTLLDNTINFEEFIERSNYTIYHNNIDFPGSELRDTIILTSGNKGIILEGVRKNTYFDNVWDNFDIEYFHPYEDTIVVKDREMYRNVDNGEVIILNDDYSGVKLKKNGLEGFNGKTGLYIPLNFYTKWIKIDELIFNENKNVINERI